VDAEPAGGLLDGLVTGPEASLTRSHSPRPGVQPVVAASGSTTSSAPVAAMHRSMWSTHLSRFAVTDSADSGPGTGASCTAATVNARIPRRYPRPKAAKLSVGYSILARRHPPTAGALVFRMEQSMAVTITDLPSEQRPRERLFAAGVEALSDTELLALVLRQGRQGESAIDMATALLAEYGGLTGLSQARPEELTRRAGVGAGKAAALVAAFRLASRISEPVDGAPILRGPADVASVAGSLLATARRERLVVLVCDARDRLRHRVVVAEGAIDRCPIPVREVLNAVLRHDGRAFAVAHNHPSGDPEPSQADRQATVALADGARTVGLRFLDHIVVAGNAWASATSLPRTPG